MSRKILCWIMQSVCLLLVMLHSLCIAQEGHVAVAQILPGSNAEKVGLQAHDVLLSFEGTDITSVKQFLEVRGNRPGTLHIRRGEQVFSLDIPEGRLGAVITRAGARWEEFQKKSPKPPPAAEHVKKATELMDSLQFLDAAQLFESVINAGIADPQLYLWTARCYVKLLEQQPSALNEKFLRNALHYTQLARERIPEDQTRTKELSDLYFLLGRLDMLQGSYEAARANFVTSLRWDPANPSSQWQLGWALKNLGKADESLQYLEQGAQGLPQNEDLLLDLAHAYADAKKYEKADANYRKVLELNPKLVAARLDRADALTAMKRYAEAEEEVKRVLDTKDPPLSRSTSGSAYDSLGRIAYAQNDFRRATESLRKAVEFYPFANTFFLLAGAEMQIGEYRAAGEHISLYIRNLPEAQRNSEYSRGILTHLLPLLSRKEWDELGLTPYGDQLHLKPKSTWRDVISFDNPLVKIGALIVFGAVLILLHRILMRRKRVASGNPPD